MFTREELNILQAALRTWVGKYGTCNLETLNPKEIKLHKDSLKLAANLADRFEEILNDYYNMENNFRLENLK